MELEKKQIREKNRLGMIISIIIAVSILLITVLGFVNAVTPPLLVRLAVGILIILVVTLLYGKFKDSMVYRHICSVAMILLYLVTIFSGDLPEMYAIVYSIAMLVMLFSSMQMSIMGAGAAILGTVVYGIMLINKGTMTPVAFVVDIVYVVATCTIACAITKLQNRQNAESIQTVRHGADQQLKTSHDIVHLAEELNKRFVDAQEMASALTETMKTSNDSVSEIAQSTRMNAEAIEKQTGQTADIQQSINDVGDEARNMEEISTRTHASVEEGVLLIEQLKKQATEVAKINTETKQTTEQLNESIRDVQEITNTILGISSQTNLLALNASIEAARAGEAGKGFAVVADEIRKLSEDTRKATEEISNIIAKLTEDAESAANSMTLSAEYADKQNELITQTGDKLVSIKAETDVLYNGVMQVSNSVANIVTANGLIMDSITNLSATEQQVAASTETAMSLSDSSMDALKNMNAVLGDISQISEEMGRVARG